MARQDYLTTGYSTRDAGESNLVWLHGVIPDTALDAAFVGSNTYYPVRIQLTGDNHPTVSARNRVLVNLHTQASGTGSGGGQEFLPAFETGGHFLFTAGTLSFQVAIEDDFTEPYNFQVEGQIATDLNTFVDGVTGQNNPPNTTISFILPEAPDAPASLTVIPTADGGVFTWPLPDDNGGALTEIDLEWREGTTGAWTEVHGLAATTTTYTLTGRPNSTEHQVRVRGVNSAGDGAWREETWTTTTPVTLPAWLLGGDGSEASPYMVRNPYEVDDNDILDLLRIGRGRVGDRATIGTYFCFVPLVASDWNIAIDTTPNNRGFNIAEADGDPTTTGTGGDKDYDATLTTAAYEFVVWREGTLSTTFDPTTNVTSLTLTLTSATDPPNQPPSVTATISDTSPYGGEAVTVTAMASDYETGAFSYQWTATIDGTFADDTAASTDFTPINPASTVRAQILVQVTDSGGLSASAVLELTVHRLEPVTKWKPEFFLQVTKDGVTHDLTLDTHAGIRAKRGRPPRLQRFGRSLAGELRARVQNTDGQWDFLEPGDRVALLMRTVHRGAPVTIWSGVIDARPHRYLPNQPRELEVTAKGMLSLLDRGEVSVQQRDSIDTGAAHEALMQAVDIPAAVIDESGSDLVTMQKWFVWKERALEAARAIETTTRGGFLYEDTQWQVVLEHRLKRTLTPAYRLQFPPKRPYGTITRISVLDRASNTASDGFISTSESVKSLAEQTLWAADSDTTTFPISIAAGDTITILALYPTPEVGRSHIGVDAWETVRHVTSGADTADYSTSGTPAPVSGVPQTVPANERLTFIPTQTAEGLSLAIENTQSATVELTRLRLRGHPLQRTAGVTVRTPATGGQVETVPKNFLPTIADHEALHTYLERDKAVSTDRLIVSWRVDDPVLASQIELSDRVQVTEQNIDSDWFIDQIEHVIARGNVHTMMLGLVSAAAYTPITLPGAPTGLQAAVTPGLLTLTWEAPADTGGSEIVRYDVRARQGTGLWASWPHNQAARTALITGLIYGESYEFQVRAANILGEGPWSSGATATPGDVPGVPVFTTTHIPDPDPNESQVGITITTVPDANGYAITGYQYEGEFINGADQRSGTFTGTTVTYLVIGVGSYRVRVRAQNALGYGAWSDYTQFIINP